jgi:CRISPR/Cas system-associated protein Cas10 (large subunit of type III CRISPR-Cas system)
MGAATEKCPWCGALFAQFNRREHMRSHLVQVERFRQEIHGEIEPMDLLLADLMA